MSTFWIRESTAEDLHAVSELLDSTIGAGFWNHDELLCGQLLVADLDGSVVGVGAASLDAAGTGATGPVGQIRLIAVDTRVRGRGIATALIRELVAWCERGGATSCLAYAWVHRGSGIAPLARALKRSGFELTGRIDGLYAGVGATCPACSCAPCECPADVYRLEASWTGS